MAVTGTGTDVWILSSTGDTIEGWMYIRQIKWAGTATGGDDVKIMDYDSVTNLLDGKAVQYSGCCVNFDQPRGKAVNGIKATLIDSGKVFVFLA